MKIPQTEISREKNIESDHIFTEPNGYELSLITELIESGKIKPVVTHVAFTCRRCKKHTT